MSSLDKRALEAAWREASIALREHAPDMGAVARTALMQVVADAAITAYVANLVSREDDACRVGSKKMADLVHDAFDEGCRAMQSWNGVLGPMDEGEIFATWMHSDSRERLMAWQSQPEEASKE